MEWNTNISICKIPISRNAQEVYSLSFCVRISEQDKFLVVKKAGITKHENSNRQVNIVFAVFITTATPPTNWSQSFRRKNSVWVRVSVMVAVSGDSLIWFAKKELTLTKLSKDDFRKTEEERATRESVQVKREQKLLCFFCRCTYNRAQNRVMMIGEMW